MRSRPSVPSGAEGVLRGLGEWVCVGTPGPMFFKWTFPSQCLISGVLPVAWMSHNEHSYWGQPCLVHPLNTVSLRLSSPRSIWSSLVLRAITRQKGKWAYPWGTGGGLGETTFLSQIINFMVMQFFGNTHKIVACKIVLEVDGRKCTL